MTAGSYVIQLRQVGDLTQVADTAGVNNRRPDVVDELFLNELLTIVDATEYFADCERSCRVLPDQTEALLKFRWYRVLQPEQSIRLEVFAKPRRFDRGEPVMSVVKEHWIGTEL